MRKIYSTRIFFYKLPVLSCMAKEDKSTIPQPKCPVNFEILAANVQAVEERSKIGHRSNSRLCKTECLVKRNHGYIHITSMSILHVS